MRDQVIALEYEADGVVPVRVPVGVPVLLRADAVDQQVSVRVLVEAAENVQHRRLAAAGRSEYGNELALSESEIDAPEGPYDFGACPVFL